jgi:hypothetical protein
MNIESIFLNAFSPVLRCTFVFMCLHLKSMIRILQFLYEKEFLSHFCLFFCCFFFLLVCVQPKKVETTAGYPQFDPAYARSSLDPKMVKCLFCDWKDSKE